MLKALFTRSFETITAAILAAMVIVTAVDVAGRYLFNSPLEGAFELVEVSMAALIFAALPLVASRKEHIVVDVFDRYLSESFRRVQELVVQIVCACIIAVLAYIFFDVSRQVQADGLFTSALRLPLAPVAYFGAIAILVSGLVHLVLAIRTLTKIAKSPTTLT